MIAVEFKPIHFISILCRVLDYVGISYHLRDFADIQAARGF